MKWPLHLMVMVVTMMVVMMGLVVMVGMIVSDCSNDGYRSNEEGLFSSCCASSQRKK